MDPWFLRCEPSVDPRSNVPWDEEGIDFRQCIDKYEIHFDGKIGLEPEDQEAARAPPRWDIHHWVPRTDNTHFLPEFSETTLWQWRFVNCKYEVPLRHEIEKYKGIGRFLAGFAGFGPGKQNSLWQLLAGPALERSKTLLK